MGNQVQVSRQSRFFSFGMCVLLIIGGALFAVLVSGTLGQVLAFVLVALARMGLTSPVSVEAGLSGDRQRAREEAAAGRKAEESARGRSVAGRRRGRTRLGRMRGRSRRLGL
jgi:hypothetical protein